jgi:hypothetical protein
LRQPVVAFYDIEAEIYTKARQRTNDHAAEDSSEGENNEDKDGGPPGKDIDGDIDLASHFLRDILSDERPAPDSEGIMPPVVATHMEMGSHEATEEEWENM